MSIFELFFLKQHYISFFEPASGGLKCVYWRCLEVVWRIWEVNRRFRRFEDIFEGGLGEGGGLYTIFPNITPTGWTSCSGSFICSNNLWIFRTSGGLIWYKNSFAKYEFRFCKSWWYFGAFFFQKLKIWALKKQLFLMHLT